MSDEENVVGVSKRARPGGRASQVVAAIHAATLELLEEGGYERLELPEVAARAGVNKTTVYRRWPSKVELVLEISLLRMRQDVPLPNTGTLLGDLSGLLFSVAATLQMPLVAGLLQAVVGQRDEFETVRRARAQFWSERFAVSGRLVERAIERGELPLGTNPREFLELASSPLFFRLVITGETYTEAELREIARRVVLAFKSV